MTIEAEYIYAMLEKKGSKISKTVPSIGDLIFDYNGDFIGICVEMKQDTCPLGKFTTAYIGEKENENIAFMNYMSRWVK